MSHQTTKVPVKVPVYSFKKLFSKVKIYIPKKEKNGILQPCVDKGCNWYVYYYFRNPYTDKMEKIIEKRGINMFKTLTERKKAANNLKKACTVLLQKGYSPFKEELQLESSNDIDQQNFTVKEAFELVYEEKKKVWSANTINNNSSLNNVFIKWLVKNNLSERNINELKKRHISLFLNSLDVNNITRNNYRRIIVALVQQMVSDDIITNNFTNSIPKLKESPEKNKPFTKQQLKDIKKYLVKNDPYLYLYIQFIMYAFLRPIEVTRIKIKDINLAESIISLRTKTENYATVFIIEKLKEVINNMNIDFNDQEYYLFTKFQTPNFWETQTEKGKTRFFSHKFLKLKIELQLNENYGLYSFRHTFALDLYNTYLKQGLTQLEAKHKLMTITRHKSMSGLENYLRDIGAELPKDYSSDYSIDF